MNKVIILLLFVFMALGLSAQTPINTQTGIVPVHNLRVEDTTYFGQLIGIWAIDAGDTMFGFVPVYVLPDSTLLVGSDTVYSSGNPQVITLSGDVTGSGTSSIVTNIAAGAVGATELQSGAVTTVKIAASAVDSTKIGANAVGPSELQSTAVSPGSYTTANITVDADGRITSATNGVGVTDGDKGDITVSNTGATWTIDNGAVTTVKIAASAVDSTKIGANAVGPSELQSTAVSPGSYTLSSVTVDADGRLTAASNGTVNLASQVTGTLPVANGGTGATSLSGAGIATTATGTVNYVPKYTAGTVFGNSQIFDNGTNIGIGTATPTATLQIQKADPVLQLRSNDTTGINYIQTFSSDRHILQWLSLGHLATGSDRNYDVEMNVRTGGNDFVIGTNDVRWAYFTKNNRLGLGISSPSQRLHISGNIFSDGTNAQFLGDDAVNSVTTPTYSFSGDTDNGMYRPAADNIGLVTNGTEKLRITSAGNVGIGTTSPGSPLVIRGTTATDGGQLGSELLTTANWTTTDWTGDFTTGFTHTTGNTTALTNTLAAVINNFYYISITVSNRTAGSFSVTFGGQSSLAGGLGNNNGANNLGIKATATNSLVITPTSDFNGTILVSVKTVGDRATLMQINGSNNAITSIHANTDQTSLFFGATSGLKFISAPNTIYNTGVGYSALRDNISGGFNTAYGGLSLQANTHGNQNTGLGYLALGSNVSGGQNAAIGFWSMRFNTTGSYNVAIGSPALQNNTTGSFNMSFGFWSLESNTTGSNNVAIGSQSLYSNTTGSSNIGIGVRSGRYTSDGLTANSINTNNIFIGAETRSSANDQTNQIVIGHSAIGEGSNSVVLGNTAITKTVLRGNVGIGTTTPTNHLDVNGSARIRTFTGTPKRIIGADLSGVLDTLVLGSGLSITSGTLNTTNNGTVSSVGLTMPTGFTVSNSPVTTSGTLAVTTTLNGPLRGNGSGFTTGNTNLASEVTGTLPVANGGTGVTTLTANKVLVGNGTSTVLSPTNLHWDNTNSRLGISETSPAYPLDINANTAMRLPRGLDTNQPAAAAGLFRFSTTTNTVDWSDGTNWYKGISGEGQGPSSNFNRVALWSGASTQTSDADLTFNPSTGQLKMLKYTGASTFTGTSVAELHVTSTGDVITKTPRDTQYVHLVAVTPGTAVTQTAGFDFFQGSFLMPEHLDNYTLSRADYAITNSTATTGSLTVRIRYYDTTNSGGSTACAVTFTGADVRESSTNGLVMPKGYWMHAEVGSTNGTLNNTVEGLLVTLMFTK